MNQLARFSLAALFASATVSATFAQQPRVAKTAVATATGEVGGGSIERGKYIVENVAQCGRCHTPGGDKGQPDHRRWLQGAPIRDPDPNWAVQSARIAGDPPGTDEQFVNLMMTGISRTGAPPKAPMPSFRMTRPDAEAVLAYLKSLRK